jgi:signal transduction histidine kinase
MTGAPSARILIVDDESALMKALCNTLRDHNYETVGFTSGAAALAELGKTKFHLLLADLMMPEMGGIDLLRAALKLDPDLVPIIMTGQGTIDTAVEAMKTGALDYILKPFKLGVVMPVLSRALTVRQLRLEKAELEQRVRARTLELEAANKELEAFSYSVSHDLRAPLRAVASFSQILVQEHAAQMSEEAGRFLKIITSNTRRMEQLIEDLLRLSRLGREPLAKKTVDLSVLVHEVVEELRQDQGGRPIEVRVGRLPGQEADPALLRQAFINLLSNAFKFTREKNPAVVEVDCRKQEGEDVYFVRDNGAGFDMQYAEKLFGVFQRLHSGEEFEGTGVGLSIVQRVIQRHGGRIWAEGQVGQGATFYFTLPG